MGHHAWWNSSAPLHVDDAAPLHTLFQQAPQRWRLPNKSETRHRILEEVDRSTLYDVGPVGSFIIFFIYAETGLYGDSSDS
jgi:hypothetical protein